MKHKHSVREVTIKLLRKNPNLVGAEMLTSMLQETVEEKWKPKMDQVYYYPHLEGGYSCSHIWVDDEVDNNLYSLGLVFKTEKESDDKLEKIISSLKG